MADEPKLLVSQDLRDVLTFVDSARGVAHPYKDKSAVRAVHNAVFATTIIAEVAAKTTAAEHGHTYIGTAASSLLRGLRCLVTGDGVGLAFYLRGAIEDLWSHIYFKDHGVEYRWAVDDEVKFYMSAVDLRTYARRVEELKPAWPCLDGLDTRYSELSTWVHAQQAPERRIAQTLEGIAISETDAAELAAAARDIGRTVVAASLIADPALLSALHPDERSWLIGEYLDAARRKLVQHIGDS